jgi:hypothetical protein
MDILSYISGIITGGIGVKIIGKIIDWKMGELSENKRQKKLNRFQLSQEILKILNEGSNKSWRKRPNDSSHLNYIGRLLQMEDSELSIKYDSFITTWQLTADRSSSSFVGAFSFGQPIPEKKRKKYDDEEKFIASSITKLNELDKEISDELKKWR